MRLPLSEYILTFILSCTISNLLRIIGQIFAFDRGYLSVTRSYGGKLIDRLKTMRFGFKNLETSLYRTVRNVFDILNHVR